MLDAAMEEDITPTMEEVQSVIKEIGYTEPAVRNEGIHTEVYYLEGMQRALI